MYDNKYLFEPKKNIYYKTNVIICSMLYFFVHNVIFQAYLDEKKTQKLFYVIKLIYTEIP